MAQKLKLKIVFKDKFMLNAFAQELKTNWRPKRVFFSVICLTTARRSKGAHIFMQTTTDQLWWILLAFITDADLTRLISANIGFRLNIL